ncbi:MAG: biotin--[acetyl-CoA-carboxylase] ligase [Candidatus Cyclonatronum sp.]|uniref:biotin--[acetyl-CoA-carboxylase] ligase n=1 Tax=Cyclonatronum sp. TaxID=3024185 RepID=UPI0025BC7F70|nr:biotin--[acetyl-CoA-carboxylase] ligase [Cyclonatronum sp.]MCH8487254.1 biotin--[acetyl-CoA-carboxylase] ligase [Cyclonatronum sp.]
MKNKTPKSAGLIDFIRLNKALTTRLLGTDFWYFEKLASTNTLVKKMPAELVLPGLVCVAGMQHAGRGQRQNRWLTAENNALTFSVVFKPADDASLPMLLQLSAYAVVSAIKKHCAVNATLKWPNDVLVGGKKVCGILAESTFIGSELERFVIGIGINTNDAPVSQVGDYAVSLGSILDRCIDHTDLLAAVLNELEEQYIARKTQLKQQLLEINRLHRGYGQLNYIKTEGVLLDGKYKFLGLDLTGYPVFLDEEDNVKRFTKQDIRFEPVS